jgi:hypothetical protein
MRRRYGNAITMLAITPTMTSATDAEPRAAEP